MQPGALVSAVLYLGMFAMALMCFAATQWLLDNMDGIPGRLTAAFFACVGILLPSAMAGLRGDEVGVDVLVYAIPNFEDAIDCVSVGEVNEAIKGSWEWGYAFLLYVLTRLTDDHGWLLFMFQLLTAGPLAVAAILARRRVSIVLAMAFYLFCYYNNSLNMMRQSVSCAFVVLGAVLLHRGAGRMTLGTLAVFMFALLFHKSAAIGVVGTVALYWWARLHPDGLSFKILVFAVLAILAAQRLAMPVLERLSSLNVNFEEYFNVFMTEEGRREDWFINPFAPAQIVPYACQTVLALGPYAARRLILSKCASSDEAGLRAAYDFCALSCLAGWIVYSLFYFGMKTVYGGRMSIFLDMMVLLAWPMMIKCLTERRMASLSVVICLAAYWFMYVIRLGWSGSELYVFR